jgi:hypothetical protein
MDRLARRLAGTRSGVMSALLVARDAASSRMKTTSTSSRGGDSSATPRLLKQSMTALVRLVHPDVLAATHPDLSSANAEALAHLQGTLDGVQKRRELPGAKVRRLRFYVRDEAAGEAGVRAVPFTLRTTGGDCRNVLRRDLGALFASVGIEREFSWGEGDWSTTRTEEEEAEEKRRRNEYAETSRSTSEPEVAQAYREPMPSNASSSGRRGMDVHEALKALDPAFEAIAACAWLSDDDADEKERKRVVMFEVIPHLVSSGWNLKGDTVEAIWRGERDEKVLLDGLDGGSALAVVSVLKWTKNLERMYGTAPMNTKSN